MDDRAAALARLFESVHEGLYIGTVDPDRTIAANPHLKSLLGYPAHTPDRDVLPFARDRFADEQARDHFIQRLDAGHVREHQVRLRRADGAPVWVEITAMKSGSHIHAVVRDVSDRKRLDDQSRELYHQLLQAEKMAALGQTISGVAHELNNPLATILSWAERLADHLSRRSLEPMEQAKAEPVDDKTRRGLDVIRGESERAARIVRSLLTFARKRQSTRTMVDINEVVSDTLALRAYEQRDARVEVVQSFATTLPDVFADAYQIKQVILNLLINAEQAMVAAHGRGTLTIRTWHDRDRDAVVIEVNDDGPGIAEGVQGKIFDPFFTTKGVGKGTGLGLSVAYGIVQEHGGRIWCTSSPRRPSTSLGTALSLSPLDVARGDPELVEGSKGRSSASNDEAKAGAPGAGASFFVELPAGKREAPSTRGTPSTLSTPSTAGTLGTLGTPGTSGTPDFRGLRVLVVEDEPALATAVSEALTDAGFEVERAGDGEEGLAALKTHAYDLVVCDLKMPKVDGIQFYRATAAATPALARRVIFVTGAVAGTDAERFLEETGCRWLAKPFRLGDLLRAARDTLS